MDSTKKQARIAGLLYVLIAVTAPVGLGDVAGILEFGELPIILWLLIWGAKAQSSIANRPNTGIST
jgi:hypothetical protein